jgi:hypothetical protein
VTRRAPVADRLDDAVEALLLGRPRALPAPDDELAGLLDTARLLHEGLPRLHPSFGSEERLARRLAAVAAGAGSPMLLALPVPDGTWDAGMVEEGAPPATRWRRRDLVAGGAIASGLSLAIPIVGAALLAYRRVRAPGGMP